MATDFTYSGKTIVTSGGIRPSGKNTPGDVRTRVNIKADAESIPNPYIGMPVIVLQDESNGNKITEYRVKSLKENGLGVADTVVNELVLLKDFLEIAEAEKYIHPDKHPASIITQDANNRFVSDTEKTIWNSKSSFSGSYNDLTDKPTIPTVDVTKTYVDTELAKKLNSAGHILTDNNYTTVEKTKLASLNNYTHPVNHPASIITQDSNNRFVTDAEKTSWTSKSDFSGNYNDLTNKPNIPVVDVTKTYVDSELAKKINLSGHVLTDNNYTTAEKNKLSSLNNYTHPSNHSASIITQDSNNRFVTDAEKTTWNAKEPSIVKATAFNKNFGTTAGTVAEGSHTHSLDYATTVEIESLFA